MAKVVYSFGRADQLDADQLRRLAARIKRVVSSDGSRIGAEPGGEDLRIRDSWTYGASTIPKVVEYDRAGARVLQTTEVREEAAALLEQLGVPLPQRCHAIEPVPAT